MIYVQKRESGSDLEEEEGEIVGENWESPSSSKRGLGWFRGRRGVLGWLKTRGSQGGILKKKGAGGDLEEEEGFWKDFKRENGDRNIYKLLIQPKKISLLNNEIFLIKIFWF